MAASTTGESLEGVAFLAGVTVLLHYDVLIPKGADLAAAGGLALRGALAKARAGLARCVARALPAARAATPLPPPPAPVCKLCSQTVSGHAHRLRRCGHGFHGACVLEHIKGREHWARCPVCAVRLAHADVDGIVNSPAAAAQRKATARK